jgi:hypothetical protein
MKKINVILFLTFLANSCFAQANEDLTTITQSGFNFKYPTSWKLDTSGLMGSKFFIFSPLEDDSDVFSENINGSIEDLKDLDIDISQYLSVTLSQFENLMTDGKIIESAMMNKGNEKYFKIIYTMRQGKFKIKGKCVCFIRNEKAYLLTFTAEDEKFENFEAIADEILNSLEVAKI